MGVKHIDFFSLDVESAEIDILSTFPFEEITVDVWAIEHTRPLATMNSWVTKLVPSKSGYELEDEKLISFMESKGYYFFDMFCHVISDYIFVRRNSSVFESLEVPPEFWKRRGLCLEKGDYRSDVKDDLKNLRDRHHWPDVKFQNPRDGWAPLLFPSESYFKIK